MDRRFFIQILSAFGVATVSDITSAVTETAPTKIKPNYVGKLNYDYRVRLDGLDLSPYVTNLTLVTDFDWHHTTGFDWHHTTGYGHLGYRPQALKRSNLELTLQDLPGNIRSRLSLSSFDIGSELVLEGEKFTIDTPCMITRVEHVRTYGEYNQDNLCVEIFKNGYTVRLKGTE